MFFTIIVQKMKEEGTTAQAIYKYDSLDAAKQKFHAELSASIGSVALDYAMCAVLTEQGDTVMKEAWYAPAEVVVEE